MKSLLPFVLMLLVAPVCVAGQEWKAMTPTLTAALDVDAQGHVVHAQLLGKDVLPQLQSLTEQTTRNWRFVPATIGGKAATARTYALFVLETRKLDGKQQVRLHYDVHGPGRVFIGMPNYPTEMIRRLVSASIVVAFDVNRDGSVSNEHVTSAKTSGGVRGNAFYQAAIQAASKDKFLPELVDGRPVVTHMSVPYDFTVSGFVATELRNASDAPQDKGAEKGLDLPHFANIPVALDSPLKLVATTP